MLWMTVNEAVMLLEHLMTMMTTVYDDSMTMTLKEKLTHSIYLLF